VALLYTPQGRCNMSMEMIGNVMDVVRAKITTRTSARKQPDPQPDTTQSDVVSVGNSQGTDNIGKIHWPPLFPIGDTQSIFKINK
jgi:hypothetical protein